ncbi:MAG: universal stress protein [Thermodesulfobacteriota bacterium]
MLLVLSTSRTSEEVLGYAVEKAAEAGVKLVALYILEKELAEEVFDAFTDVGFIGDRPSVQITESLMKEYRQRGYEELGRLQIRTMEAGVDFDPLMEEGDYVTTVLDAMEGRDIGLAVLIKRRKRSFFKYFSKSLAEEVKEKAPCEVVIFEEE